MTTKNVLRHEPTCNRYPGYPPGMEWLVVHTPCACRIDCIPGAPASVPASAPASDNAPQPAPKPNAGAECWAAVIADMHERNALGTAKYGTPLCVGDGRDALVDAYQEALDLAVYLKKAILERDAARAQSAALRSHLEVAVEATARARLHLETAVKVAARALRCVLVDGDCDDADADIA